MYDQHKYYSFGGVTGNDINSYLNTACKVRRGLADRRRRPQLNVTAQLAANDNVRAARLFRPLTMCSCPH